MISSSARASPGRQSPRRAFCAAQPAGSVRPGQTPKSASQPSTASTALRRRRSTRAPRRRRCGSTKRPPRSATSRSWGSSRRLAASGSCGGQLNVGTWRQTHTWEQTARCVRASRAIHSWTRPGCSTGGPLRAGPAPPPRCEPALARAALRTAFQEQKRAGC
eukprot:scaffold4623_cov104-Isochrysis_galbana.AAC.2